MSNLARRRILVQLLPVCFLFLILCIVLSPLLYHGLSPKSVRQYKQALNVLPRAADMPLPLTQLDTNTNSTLHARVPTPDTYDDAVRKGEFKAMILSTGTISSNNQLESQFTKFSDLETHGWRHVTVSSQPYEARTQPIRKLIRDLMMHWREGIGMSIQPPPPKKPGQGRITGGHVSSYNIYNGILIAYNSLSPWQTRHPTKEDTNPAGYPDLHYWSDVSYLVWMQQCEAYLKAESKAAAACQRGPSIVVQSGIDNPLVTDFLFEISRRWGNQPPNQAVIPAYEFRYILKLQDAVYREMYFAALGTVLGSGVTRLFVNHVHDWGEKQISEIWIYSHQDRAERLDRRAARPTVVFGIDPVEKQGLSPTSSHGDAEQEIEESDGAFPAHRPSAAAQDPWK
ncbi:hypothetical protein LTR78_002509 [Recurvomyces mirabilis]|uniref:Uncharacterized protein n=1 Tax=Recurvomyces mirabilis TaxID=574656 RepID=A0AAE0WTC5_9PEZI|nr:hypothetical protein LTR78_002509 [Recurvomyces mirabilis]KAK5157438.1 hypothetical protein LTS14_004203 [Recurvomyces mirabilis]